MNRTLARYVPIAILTAALGLSPAFATFHLMVVEEVFPGTADAPDAQYVMLRMTSGGQNFVSGTFITVQDAAGNSLGRFGTFDHSVAAGGGVCSWPNCPAVLIGTGAAQTLLGFTFDQIVDAQSNRVPLPAGGGRICFRSTTSVVDCVAWGNYTGGNTIPSPTVNGCDADFGSPAVAIPADHALRRTAFNCAAKENSADFGIGFPHPVANSGANANTDQDADDLILPLDCNDGDPTALFPPVEVSGLNVDGASPATLTWDSQASRAGTGVAYDSVTGLASDLGSSGDYLGAVCLSPGVGGALFSDPQPDPATGEAYYYLVRAMSSCGEATFGDSGLAVDPRDMLDISSPCP